MPFALQTPCRMWVLLCCVVLWPYICCVMLCCIALCYAILYYFTLCQVEVILKEQEELRLHSGWEHSIGNCMKYFVGPGCHFKWYSMEQYQSTRTPTWLRINNMEVHRSRILVLNLTHTHSWYVYVGIGFLPLCLVVFLWIKSINICCSCPKWLKTSCSDNSLHTQVEYNHQIQYCAWLIQVLQWC